MDAIITVNEEQRIVLFNAAAEAMFGYSSEQALGSALDIILPERFRDIHRKHVQQFGETGTTNRAMGHLRTLFGRRSDGSEFPIEASISQVQTSKGHLFSVIVRDVTARVQAEAQLKELHEQTIKRMHQMSALRTIDLAISSSLDLRVTLSVILEQVINELGVDAADVLLLDPRTQMLDFAAGRGFITQAAEQNQILLGIGLAGAAALDQKTVQVPDVAEAPADFIRRDVFSKEQIEAFFVTPLVAKGETKGVLEVFHRAPFQPDAEWLSFFEALAGQAAIAIDGAQLFSSLQKSNQQLLLAYNTTIEGWSRALDLRDRETEGHTQRVTEMTLRLAQSLDRTFTDDQMVHIQRGALLHDIGKMGVPDRILLKPGKLTREEWKVMRKHPEYAYELLYPITYLRQALDIPYYHHERWDGSGYPHGLKGEQIPLAARVFAVADVWDALRSDRPYREGWQDELVYEYIDERAGTQFDPMVVDLFRKVISQ